MSETKVKPIKLDEVKQYKSPEDRMALVPDVDLFYDQILISSHMVKQKSMIIETKGLMSPDQVVVAAGPNAPVKPGDWIRVNVDMFPKSQRPGGHDIGNITTVHPPLEKIGNTEYLYITGRHIKFRFHKKE
jgi:hypothetical protein